MSIGEKIRQARAAAHMTQAELASVLGVSYQNIGQWENEKRMPKISTIMKIADALGIEDYTVFLDSTDIEVFKELATKMEFSMSDRLMGEQIRSLVLPVLDGVEYDVHIEVRLAE